MKIVSSRPEVSSRFISAIWNSYSKSLTARNPRMMSRAPTSPAKSTSRPVNARTSIRGSLPTAARMSSTRTSMSNSSFLAELFATPTTRRSTNARLRRIQIFVTPGDRIEAAGVDRRMRLRRRRGSRPRALARLGTLARAAAPPAPPAPLAPVEWPLLLDRPITRPPACGRMSMTLNRSGVPCA